MPARGDRGVEPAMGEVVPPPEKGEPSLARRCRYLGGQAGGSSR